MKVLHVGKYYAPHRGGIERAVEELCQGLKDGCALEVLCFNDAATSVTDVVEGVVVHRMARWESFFSVPIAPGMFWWLRERSYDVVHLHVPNPLAELTYLAAGPGGKLVVTHHADPQKAEGLRRIYWPLERRILDRAEAICVASPYHVSEGTLVHPWRDKAAVIPYGIGLARYAPPEGPDPEAEAWRARMGGKPFALFVGRLVPYKGLGVLMDAMRRIDRSLAVVGSGPFFANLQQLRDGMEERVQLLGEVPDAQLPALYRAAGVLVLPSLDRSEAFGMVQVEAFAAGTPVVASNLPTGVSWVNRHGETGLLVPPGDAGALARAIDEILGDPAGAKRMGEAARRRAHDLFSREAYGAATLALYRRLLGEGAS